jgi:hypothetical protein
MAPRGGPVSIKARGCPQSIANIGSPETRLPSAICDNCPSIFKRSAAPFGGGYLLQPAKKQCRLVRRRLIQKMQTLDLKSEILCLALKMPPWRHTGSWLLALTRDMHQEFSNRLPSLSLFQPHEIEQKPVSSFPTKPTQQVKDKCKSCGFEGRASGTSQDYEQP